MAPEHECKQDISSPSPAERPGSPEEAKFKPLAGHTRGRALALEQWRASKVRRLGGGQAAGSRRVVEQAAGSGGELFPRVRGAGAPRKGQGWRQHRRSTGRATRLPCSGWTRLQFPGWACQYNCCLTPRSTRDPTRRGAWAAKPARPSIGFAAQAPRRAGRVSSHVRPQERRTVPTRSAMNSQLRPSPTQGLAGAANLGLKSAAVLKKLGVARVE